jgi:D-alanyl-lipoteichoic acid acyltransferase DltB (MBOAT superfamily)
MSWNATYIVLIIFSTLVDYICALEISNSESIRWKRFYLVISLVSNLGLLFLFKYFDFFSDSVVKFLKMFTIQLDPFTLGLILPVGISFYAFQSIGYVIDVYRGNMKAEKHLGIFALYISFFPQLVAGPIERAANLLPQFYKEHKFEFDRFVCGLKIMLWGFFKKVVIADRLALYVNHVYSYLGIYSGMELIIATLLFGIQIYCDFSGYSDIAIGSAKIMGVDLMDNFRRPYYAKSVFEFWKRWHISLSSWFKDYLYIPLGGNRVSVARWCVNILIVFFLSGLWHGAKWTFVIWGLLNGFYMIFSHLTRLIREKFVSYIGLNKFPYIHDFIKTAITFTLINIGWVFFRANTLADAIYILTNIFRHPGEYFGFFIMIITAITPFIFFVYLSNRLSIFDIRLTLQKSLKIIFFIILLIIILIFIVTILFIKVVLAPKWVILLILLLFFSVFAILRLYHEKPILLRIALYTSIVCAYVSFSTYMIFYISNIILVLFFIFCLELVQNIQERGDDADLTYFNKEVVQWFAYILLLFIILLFGVFQEIQFIYFQF